MARSEQLISRSGYFEWTHDANRGNNWVGLGNNKDETAGSGSNDLPFAFDGNSVRELGIYKTETNLVQGDKLRIEINTKGLVVYKKNGVLIYRSKVRPSGFYYLVFKSQETIGNRISNANFGGINYGF